MKAYMAAGPGKTLSDLEKSAYQHREYLDRRIEDLRKVGLPASLIVRWCQARLFSSH